MAQMEEIAVAAEGLVSGVSGPEEGRRGERGPSEGSAEAKLADLDAPAGPGRRRLKAAEPGSEDIAEPVGANTDPEVSDKAARRQFSAKYKLEILKQADACSSPGELGALLRREGLYSSYLSQWRGQRDRGDLGGLNGKSRGRKATPAETLMQENQRLRQETQRLVRRLKEAETIIDIQKKASELLGRLQSEPPNEGNA
jgi:transposase-like protein